MGITKLLITVGTTDVSPVKKTVSVDFMIVDIALPFNAILGRRFLAAGEMVPSTVHQKLKFVHNGQLGVEKGDQKEARECYLASVKGVKLIGSVHVIDADIAEKKTDYAEE